MPISFKPAIERIGPWPQVDHTQSAHTLVEDLSAFHEL